MAPVFRVILVTREPERFDDVFDSSDRIEIVDDVRLLDEESGIDAVLLDLQHEDRDSLARMVKRAGKVPVIAISSKANEAFFAEATQKGARGVISSDASLETILQATVVVKAGGTFLGAEGQEIVDLMERAREREVALAEAQLTGREMEVLTLLSDGLSARQIASRLSLSERTVNTHVAKLYRKLGVSNRVEAIREGIRLGIVPSPK